MFTDFLHHALMIFKLGLVWLQKALDSDAGAIIGDSCVNMTETTGSNCAGRKHVATHCNKILY